MRVLLKRNPILILSSILFILLLILILQPTSLRHNDDVVDDVDENDVTDNNDVRTKYASYDKSPYMRRTQPGYMGSGVKLKKNEKKAEDEGYKRHSFNQLVSDKISLERSLPDYRNKM